MVHHFHENGGIIPRTLKNGGRVPPVPPVAEPLRLADRVSVLSLLLPSGSPNDHSFAGLFSSVCPPSVRLYVCLPVRPSHQDYFTMHHTALRFAFALCSSRVRPASVLRPSRIRPAFVSRISLVRPAFALMRSSRIRLASVRPFVLTRPFRSVCRPPVCPSVPLSVPSFSFDLPVQGRTNTKQRYRTAARQSISLRTKTRTDSTRSCLSLSLESPHE